MSGKHRKFQIRWTQRDPHRDIIKMEKVKDRILKSARVEQRVLSKEMTARIIADFSAQTL